MRATRRIFGKAPAVLLAAVLAAGLGACADAAPRYDVVLAGGRVMDPESGTDAVLDVGIRGDRIEALSEEPLAGGSSTRRASWWRPASSTFISTASPTRPTASWPTTA